MKNILRLLRFLCCFFLVFFVFVAAVFEKHEIDIEYQVFPWLV